MTISSYTALCEQGCQGCTVALSAGGGYATVLVAPNPSKADEL